MKKVIFLMLSILSLTQANAQECEEIKQENITLKKVLLLTESQNEFQVKDINVKLLSIDGDKRTQTIKIEILFTNSGVNIDRLTTRVKSVIELGGNEVLLNKARLGAKESGVFGVSTELYRDTPLKCIYTFKGVVPETKIIKAFPLPFKYHKEGTKSIDFVEDRVIFKDLEINWK